MKLTKQEEKLVVDFKSFPIYFELEKSGKKNNTVRKVTTERRFELLKDGLVTHIGIINTETKERFTREVKDITFWNDFVIITWETPIEKWYRECVALKDPDILDFIIQDVNNNFGKPDKTKITKELEKLKDIL